MRLHSAPGLEAQDMASMDSPPAAAATLPLQGCTASTWEIRTSYFHLRPCCVLRTGIDSAVYALLVPLFFWVTHCAIGTGTVPAIKRCSVPRRSFLFLLWHGRADHARHHSDSTFQDCITTSMRVCLSLRGFAKHSQYAPFGYRSNWLSLRTVMVASPIGSV
jgi:hypothetical protein